MADRVSQDAVEVVYQGTPDARVSQNAVEALVAIPSVKDRVSQIAIEVLKSAGDERDVPFIASVTTLYAPTLISPTTDIAIPFIASKTHVWSIMSIYEPGKLYSGDGNGGEGFLIRLNANGVTDTATLATSIGTGTGAILSLTGDGLFPATRPFVVTIDDEQLYISQIRLGHYFVHAVPLDDDGDDALDALASGCHLHDLLVVHRVNLNHMMMGTATIRIMMTMMIGFTACSRLE